MKPNLRLFSDEDQWRGLQTKLVRRLRRDGQRPLFKTISESTIVETCSRESGRLLEVESKKVPTPRRIRAGKSCDVWSATGPQIKMDAPEDPTYGTVLVLKRV